MANRLYQIEKTSGNTIQFSGDVGTVWYAVTNNIHVEPTSGIIENGLVVLEITSADNINAYGSITIYSDYCKPLFLDNISFLSDYPKRRVEIVYLDSNHTRSSVTITENDTFTYEYQKNDGFDVVADSSSLTFTFANETDYETREWVYTTSRNRNLFVDVLVITRPSASVLTDCDNFVCSIDPTIVNLTYKEPSCAINAFALYHGYKYVKFAINEQCEHSIFTYSQNPSTIIFSVDENVLADSGVTSGNCTFSISSICDCENEIIVNYDRYGGDDDNDIYGSIIFTLKDNTTSAIVSDINASISLIGNSKKYKYRTNFVDGVAIFKKVRYDESGYTYNLTIEDGAYIFDVLSSITTPCDIISGSVNASDFVKSQKNSYSLVESDDKKVNSPIYETIRKDIFVDYTIENVPWKVTQWSEPTLSSVTSLNDNLDYSYDGQNTLGYDIYDTATLQQDESLFVAQLPFIHEASAYTITLSSRSISESAITKVNVFNGLSSTECDNRGVSSYDVLKSGGKTLVFTNGNYPVVVEYEPNDNPFLEWETAITLNISSDEQIINLNTVGFLSDYTEFTIQTSGTTSTTARIYNSGVTVYAEAVGDGPYPITYKYDNACDETHWQMRDGFNLWVGENNSSNKLNCEVNFVAYSSLTKFDDSTKVPYSGIITIIQEGSECEKECNGVEVTSVSQNPPLTSKIPYSGGQITLSIDFKINFKCGDKSDSEAVTNTFIINIGQNESDEEQTYETSYILDNYIVSGESIQCPISSSITYSYTQEGRDTPTPCEWTLTSCNVGDLYCTPNKLSCTSGIATIYANSVTYNYSSQGTCEQNESSVTKSNVVLTSVTYTQNTSDEERTYPITISGTYSGLCNVQETTLYVPQEACCLGCDSISNFNCLTIPKSGGTNVLVATYKLAAICDDSKTSATITPLTTETCTPEEATIISCSGGTIYASVLENICDSDFKWVIKMYYDGTECSNAQGISTQNGTISTTNVIMPLFLQMNTNPTAETVNSGVTNIFAPLGFLETELDSESLTMEQVVYNPNFVVLNPITNYLFEYIGNNACAISLDQNSYLHDSVYKYSQHYTSDCEVSWTDIDTIMATYDYLSDYPQKHMGDFVNQDGTIVFTGTAEDNVDEIMRQDQLYSSAVTLASAFTIDNTTNRNDQPFVITRNNKKVYVVYKQGTCLYCTTCYDNPPCSVIPTESLDKRCCLDFVDYNYGENKRYCNYNNTGGITYEWYNATDNKQTFVLSTRPIFYNPIKRRYQWSFSTTFDTSEKTETEFPYSDTFPTISNGKLNGLSGNSETPITIFKHTASTINGGYYPFINELQTNRNITENSETEIYNVNMFPLKDGWQTLSFSNWYHDINEQTQEPNMVKIGDEQMLFGFVDDSITKEYTIEVVDENENNLLISSLQFLFTDYTNAPNDEQGVYSYDPPSTSVTANLPLFKTTMGTPILELVGDTAIIEDGDPNSVYLTPHINRLVIHVDLEREETIWIDALPN